jgi:4-aminobutyrate aminotransferase-like enzyme
LPTPQARSPIPPQRLSTIRKAAFTTTPNIRTKLALRAREAGSIWIADEVVTGAGRAGTMVRVSRRREPPDIVTLGKSLGGGAAAVAAIVVSKAIVEQLKGKSWQNYGTLRGHPVSMAAISAYLDVITREDILSRVRQLEGLFAQRLLEIARRHPSVRRVAGQGLHWTIELHGPDWRNWRADTLEDPVASRVALRALEAGAVIGTSGEQTSLFLAPPLVISPTNPISCSVRSITACWSRMKSTTGMPRRTTADRG